MDDSLGITLSAIAVAPGLEIVAQILVVIDFAVEDDPNAFVFVADGLVAGLDIDDAEAAHGQSDILLYKKAVIVGPAVDDLLIPQSQRALIHALGRLAMGDAA